MHKCLGLAVFLVLLHAVDAEVVGTVDAPLAPTSAEKGFGNITHVVALQVVSPFVFYDSTKQGNDAFSGFTIDLLYMLGATLDVNFNFELASEEDPESSDAALGMVGGWKPVGSLKEAHLAAGAIHITSNRSTTVHFTTPYYSQGYYLVVKAPQQVSDPLTFLKPFDTILWLGIIIECIIVALFMYVLESPAFGATDSDLVEGQFSSLVDSIYWAFSVLTCLPDKAPKSWGGKLVMLGHGWFMLIIMAAYTANLASFLTVKSSAPTISSFSDIATSQGKYTLALPIGEGHEDFINFEKEHYGYKFNIIWKLTWEECMDAVRSGEADATFEDEPIVQYYLRETIDDPCVLIEVGKSFAPGGYAFAFGADSLDFIPYSQALLSLQEGGEITKLARKYSIGPNAADVQCESAESDSGSFFIDEMWGLIAMTSCIIALGPIFHIVNMAYTACRRSKSSPTITISDSIKGDCEQSGQTDEALEYLVRAGIEHALKLRNVHGLRGELGVVSDITTVQVIPKPPPRLSVCSVSNE